MERITDRPSMAGNSLRVMAEAVRWGKRQARLNTISPGFIMTPLAKDELTGPRGEGYRRMIELSVAGRAGTPDEVGNVAALLMGPDGGFITGSDFLMDGGCDGRVLVRRTRSSMSAAAIRYVRTSRNTKAKVKNVIILGASGNIAGHVIDILAKKDGRHEGSNLRRYDATQSSLYRHACRLGRCGLSRVH